LGSPGTARARTLAKNTASSQNSRNREAERREKGKKKNDVARKAKLVVAAS
jgi:hypothetical protein